MRDTWPRDGILRVEIVRDATRDYDVEQSYAREERLKREKAEDVLGMVARDVDIEPSPAEKGGEAEEDDYRGK